MPRILPLLLLLFTTASFAQTPATAPATAPSKIRVACIGDSITAGGYPGFLGRMLGKDYQVSNLGVSGTTLLKKGDHPYWATKNLEKARTIDPQIVTIMLGTNDSKPQNWNDQKKDTFLPDYEALIAAARDLPSHPRVYVMIPVPAFGTHAYAINGTVLRKEITPVVQKAAEETKADVIDLYTPLADHPECFPDTVHPNAEGAQRIAAAIFSGLTGAPLITAPAMTFKAELTVTILPPHPDSKNTIHYTLDGSEPTKDSPAYDPAKPLVVTATTTVKAIGVGPEPSRDASATFTKAQVK